MANTKGSMMNTAKIAMLVLVFGLTACSEQPSEEKAEVTLAPLTTLTVKSTIVDKELMFDGVIEAINQATVSAQTSGRVTELPYDVGDLVKKGELIVGLTNIEQKARVESAQAKFKEAKANFERMKDMLTKKLVAQADFDKAESNYKTFEANVREAEEAFAYTRIFAPYAGIVVERMIKVGETVAPGTPLLTGLSLESLRAQVDIPQAHIAAIREYKTARVVLPNGKRLETSNIRFPPSAASQTHSFKVLVKLPDGDHNIYPGTLLKVAFVVGESKRILVPKTVINQRGEVSALYVLSDGKLELRMVKLGTETANAHYPILAGVVEGEEIVVDPIAAAAAYKAFANQTALGE